jgi:oligopeptide transport system substrate-binding protein
VQAAGAGAARSLAAAPELPSPAAMRRRLSAFASLPVSFRAGTFGVTAALLSLLLGAPGCGRRSTAVDAGVATQTLHLALEAEPRDLDPQVQVAFNDMKVSLALFEGLTATDERTSAPVPAAAERWEVSPDGRTWTFHLRPNLRWSDGQPLTAHDFIYSLRRVLSPSLASEYAYVLFAIDGAEDFNAGRLADPDRLGVTATDELTVVLRLAQPNPALPAILALPVAFPVPRHVITTAGTRWTRAEHFVGNGAFRLETWTPNQRIVTARNPHYHAAASTRLERVIFYPYESTAAQEAAFRAGQLHLTTGVPASRIATYQRAHPERLRQDPFLLTGFLRFNTTRPPLDDPRVRRALALGIDRRALTEQVLLGGEQPAFSLTPPDTAGYTAAAQLRHDFEAARQLLAEAGYPGGRGLPSMEIVTFTLDLNRRLLEALQDMWRRELGVEVTLALKEQRVWVTEERQLDYQISNARWIGDYVDPSTFLELFLSHSGNNATGWSDPEYDNWVQQAAAETDSARRRQLYQQAEARLLEAAPVAPIYHGTSTFLIHSSVHGWEPSLLGFHRYHHVWLE